MAGSKFDRVDRSDDRVFTTLGMSFLPRSITSDHVAETRNLDGDFRGDRATNPFRRRIVTRGKLRNREALRGAKGDIGVRTGTHFRGEAVSFLAAPWNLNCDAGPAPVCAGWRHFGADPD